VNVDVLSGPRKEFDLIQECIGRGLVDGAELNGVREFKDEENQGRGHRFSTLPV